MGIEQVKELNKAHKKLQRQLARSTSQAKRIHAIRDYGRTVKRVGEGL